MMSNKRRGTKVRGKPKHKQGSQPAAQSRAEATTLTRKQSSKALSETMRIARQYRFRVLVDDYGLAYDDAGQS